MFCYALSASLCPILKLQDANENCDTSLRPFSLAACCVNYFHFKDTGARFSAFINHLETILQQNRIIGDFAEVLLLDNHLPEKDYRPH